MSMVGDVCLSVERIRSKSKADCFTQYQMLFSRNYFEDMVSAGELPGRYRSAVARRSSVGDSGELGCTSDLRCIDAARKVSWKIRGRPR